VRAAWVDLPRLGDYVRKCWLCVLLPDRPAGGGVRRQVRRPPPASLPPLLSLREYKWAVAFPRPTDDWALGSQTLNGSSLHVFYCSSPILFFFCIITVVVGEKSI
jgi:hypothetical protein